MENRIEISHGVEVPKKSRSLDLNSLYKARVATDVGDNKLKRKAVADDRDESGERKKKKKKKGVKEASLSSLKNSSSNSKKNVDRIAHSGSSSCLHGLKDSELGSNQKLNGGTGFNVISALSLNGDLIHVPRRKRGFVGRKKSEGVQAVKQHGSEPFSKVNAVDQKSKLSGDDSGSRVESLKVKKKESFDDFKENRNSESNSNKHAGEEEEGNHADVLVVSNGDAPLKKSRRKRSKSKSLGQEGKVAVKKTEPLVENSATMSIDSQEDAETKSRRKRSKAKKFAPDGNAVAKEAERVVENSTAVCDSQDEDEENLEENAAMMLSSRFDPNCTGFSSNNKGSGLASVDEFSFLLSSGHDFVNRRSKSLSGSESPSMDAAARVLRPRKQHNEKGNSRKRRHFYEVYSGDLDAFWLVNRRIKVFWPLDQLWYYGLVNDYDKERKLHHVKYDDRDEEWIDLQSERFKLLLLPSEVPDKSQRKRSGVRDKGSGQRKQDLKLKSKKEKRELPIKDDSCISSSYLDSEPIISWLARSSSRVKSPAVKKQKTSNLSMKPVPQPLSGDNADNFRGWCESGTLRRDKRKVSRNSDSVDRFAGAMEDSASESISCSKDSKMPIVYFRRRLRKADQKSSLRCSENHARRRTVPVYSLSPCVDRIEDGDKPDVFLGNLGPGRPLWTVDDEGRLKLALPGLELGKLKFHISIPVLSVLYLYDLFGTETLWLCHAAMLLNCGTMMITWPQIHLEMLFVDNVVGLRFLLFEGCLLQALAFVFLVLTTFQKPKDRVRFSELQLPVTSVRFKLTHFQHLRKELLFAFYNYSEVANTKWMYLDWKLRRHCLLSKQLPLSECTYDNIQSLWNSEVLSPPGSQHGLPISIKGTQGRFCQGSGYMGISRSDFADITRFSDSNKMRRKFPSLELSATGVPTFFLSLHLKLLMDPSLASVNFWEHDSVANFENAAPKMIDDCLNKDSEATFQESGKFPPGSVNGDKVCTEFSHRYHNGDDGAVGSSAYSQDPEKVRTNDTVHLQAWNDHDLGSDKSALPSRVSVEVDNKLKTGSESFLNGLSVEIPGSQFGKSVEEDLHDVQQTPDLSWNTNGVIFPSPNPTAPRSTSNRNKHSSPFGPLSHGWLDVKPDLVYNGFSNGPKKPRTQVSYSLPLGGFDFSPKQKSIQKGLPPKRIRKANPKKSSDVSRIPEKNLELLSCDVNILVTASDRGWREYGAKVVLELFDHNEWRLAVKSLESTKYSYKAHQVLQPGSTNRFTHAMMWKGGKDWMLEFSDRSQWVLFKEMHEECHNRNVRAALVKNIPIPGVHVIEEGDDNGLDIPFVRGSSKYIRQAESDIEMALNPSRVIYDMDDDDERWLQNAQNSSELHTSCSGKISEEMFEKSMTMFEKAAYAQHRDQLTLDEVEELMVGVGPLDVIKGIYEHWQQKRLKNGMPLIRHLQSPAWERYQQQLEEWEQAVTKMNANGFHEKAARIEKPTMFAFCMKPRGLEVPNKGSKQRSHRKISLSSHHSNMAYGDQDGFHTYGRRMNGFSYGDERFVCSGHNYDSLDDSPLAQPFSPRDVRLSMINDGPDRSHHRKLHRSKSRKYETVVSPGESSGLYYHRTVGNRNSLRWWRTGDSGAWPQQQLQPEVPTRQLIEQTFVGSDLDEFSLRDASGAARNALNTAKFKRERAQRLAFRADWAIHKAMAALMTAEASRDCSEGSNGDG